MPDYQVCGGSLRSDIPFPELRSRNSHEPTWHFRVRDIVAPDRALTPLGSEHLKGNDHAALFAHPAGYRIHVDQIGDYDLTEDGATITWYPAVDAWLDFARAHLLGRVLATALHLNGQLTLHGSAVSYGGRAVGFVAPKFSGKSTLALALIRAGAGLLTDDILPIELSDRAWAKPGVQSLRIDPEAAKYLGYEDREPRTRDGKVVLDTLALGDVMEDPADLDGIYVVTPCVSIEGGVAVARRRLDCVAAAMALVQHTKVGTMLGSWGARDLLLQATRLADLVPVYALGVVNEFEYLPEVAHQILDWIGQPEATFQPSSSRE